MNPWVIIFFAMALIVFGVDFLLRKKKWKENSKEEKISLIVNMFSVGPYIFLSILGMLWGIVPGSPDTSFGEILFKQIAGTFARRIVTYADPGNSVTKGSQCGIIKFGSRIDMYLPLDADIKVSIGENVRACETVIAQL